MPKRARDYTPVDLTTNLRNFCDIHGSCWLWRLDGLRAMPYLHNLPTLFGVIKRIPLRRAIYLLNRGEIVPPTNMVWNRCANALCVKPNHLRQGPRAQFFSERAYKRRTARRWI